MAHPGGRPTDYTDDLPEKLIVAMYEGMSVERFCRQVRISKDTFYRWVKKHQEFSDAFQLGRNDCEAFWEEWLIERLENKDINSNLIKLFMTNRFGWGDKTETKNDHNVEVSDVTSRKVRDAENKYKTPHE